MSPSPYEEPTPVSLVAGELSVGAGDYCGYTVRETTGASSASVILYDNANSAAGLILEEITLSPGESTRDHYSRPGRRVGNGVFAAITGSVEGSVFV